jgi:hypothetical protein
MRANAPVTWANMATRWCAGVASITMAIAGAFHLLWTFTPWPLGSWMEFDRTVMGDPSAGAGPNGHNWVLSCCTIAGLLLAAAYIVSTRAGLLWRIGPWWAFRIAAWVIVGVFLGRAVFGFLANVPQDLPAHQWNLLLYSPLCLLLAVASATSIVGAGRYPSGRDATTGWFYFGNRVGGSAETGPGHDR